MAEPLLPERSATSSARMQYHRDQLVARIAAGELGADAAPRAPDVPGYRLLRVKGSGAAAEVWEAQTEAGATVAIKLFHARSPPTGKAGRGLSRELQASRRVDHPGIVRVHDAGQTPEGRAFLVMDLLSGTNLSELITREGPLAWPRARPLLAQLCDALAYAHDQGVVHRDLKPTNIVVEPGDDDERCVVVDLGLSRVLGDSVVSTIAGSLVGTPAYMSPEQVRGGAVDHRADIYALGCIAYEMLTGSRPFGGVTPGECAVQHLVAPPPRLHAPGLRHRRRALDAVIRRALAKDPTRRFADMRALAHALQEVETRRGPLRRWWWLVPAAGAALGLSLLATATATSEPEPAAPEVETPSVEPPPVTSPRAVRIVDLSLGLSHTCAVSEEGRAQCWGIDVQGRLGRATEGRNVGDNEAPADLAPLPLEGVARIVTAPNARHVCALHRDGQLRCWGHGIHGALGRGSTASFGDQASEGLDSLPALPLPGPVVDLSLSTARTCAVVRQPERRNLYCWGRGEQGALGLGSTSDLGDDETLDQLRPVPLGDDVVEVATGNDHTCARLAGGAIRCWGSDALGQLGVAGWSANIGDGRGDGRGRGQRPNDPSLDVQGLEDVTVTAMDAAGDRTCVLTAAGGVRCWGSNQEGTLGYPWSALPGCRIDDDPSACNLEAPLPFDIDLGDLGGATLVALSTGQRHTCVVDDRGRGRCWGEGTAGQLGDGESENIGHWRSPAQAWRDREDHGVVDVGDADGDGQIDPLRRIVAGMQHTCAITSGGMLRCWGSGAQGRLGYRSTDYIGLGLTPGDDYADNGVYDVRAFAPRPDARDP